MPTSPLTWPAASPPHAGVFSLLRSLHSGASSPGTFVLHEGSRTFLATEVDRTLRLPADASAAALREALESLLDTQEDDALWSLAITYEAGRTLLGTGEHIPADPELPALLAHRYRAWAVFEAGALRGEGEPVARKRLLDQLTSTQAALPPSPGHALGALRRDLEDAAYAACFESIQTGLRAGGFYQLVLTCAHRGRWQGDPLAFFERLCAAGGAPAAHALPRRAAYLDAGDLVIASASPELLLDYDPRTRLAVSAPIKGTTAAPSSHTERTRLATKLASDPKERAEHVMIVDLVRNDLGRVCSPGSVRPRALFAPLRSGPVQHLVTFVEGRLAPGRRSSELFAALFPGGSITGAPKIAAMQAIDRLEVAPRGFYCGAIGRVGPRGALSLTLPIRTATLRLEGPRDASGGSWRLTYPTGGGIVVGASTRQELAELELKAERLRRALS